MKRRDNLATKSATLGSRITWYILGVIELILAFRFFLRLFSANPDAAFTSLVYNISAPFVNPFFNVFGTDRAATGVMEWTTLLAMITYWLVAWVVVELFFIGEAVSTEPTLTNKADRIYDDKGQCLNC